MRHPLAKKKPELWSQYRVIQDTVMRAMMDDKKASKAAINLAPYLLATIRSLSTKDNLFQATQSQIGDLVGSNQANVSKAISLLKRWGFIAQVKLETGGKCVMVNPQVHFIGTGDNSTAFIEKVQKVNVDDGEISTKTTRRYGRNKKYEEMMQFYLKNGGVELPLTNETVQRHLNIQLVQPNQLLIK